MTNNLKLKRNIYKMQIYSLTFLTNLFQGKYFSFSYERVLYGIMHSIYA